MKVYCVINGKIDVQERDLAGPYFNRNIYVGSPRRKSKEELMKK